MAENEGLNGYKCGMKDFLKAVRRSLLLVSNYDMLVEIGKVGEYAEASEEEQYNNGLDMVRHPLLVVGLPGVGKTMGIRGIIKSINQDLKKKGVVDKKTGELIQFGFKSISLGALQVGELSGIPVPTTNGDVVRLQVPDLPKLEEDGEYGVLFLDEITTTDVFQVQPALGLADGTRSIGTYTLPEHWIVIGAGNGPECTNFVRADDMTLTRFRGFELVPNYFTDWKPYALASGIDDMIVAFLDFAPDRYVNIESTDEDIAGKYFATARTWETYSHILRQTKILLGQNNLDLEEIQALGCQSVGENMAREFTSFSAFAKTLKYDPDKIIEGKENKIELSVAKETLHILCASCCKKLDIIITGAIDSVGDYREIAFTSLANVVSWFLESEDLDAKINVIATLFTVPSINKMLAENRDIFTSMFCPEFGDFLDTYATQILRITENNVLEN